MKKPPKHSIVEVLWKDANGSGESWRPRKKSSCPGLAWVSTTGYVVEWKRTRITLCMQLNVSQYGKLVTIPWGCVRAWRVLGARPSDDSVGWYEVKAIRGGT